MNIIVSGEKTNIQFKGKISDLLHKLKIPREEILVKVNGKLAPEDAEVSQKDKVEIIKVVFGG